MSDPLRSEPPTPRDRRASRSWPYVAGYLTVFFTVMTLMGILFTLGGIAIVLIPGSLPTWLGVAYVAAGIAGCVLVALLAANRAFGTASRTHHDLGTGRPQALLSWVAGVAGTALAGVLSAVLATLILDWLDR